MAEISKITLPSGGSYDLKDAAARAKITTLESNLAGAIHFIGYTTTALADGSTATQINIKDVAEAYTAKSGDVVIYKDGAKELEFIFNGTNWNEFGSTGTLKALAFKDKATGTATVSTADSGTLSNGAVSASATYTPAGAVSVTLDQKATGASLTKADYKPEGTINVTLKDAAADSPANIARANYTPAGTVSVTLKDATTPVAVEKTEATFKVAETEGSVTAGEDATFTEGTFHANTPTVIDVTKFSGGSKAADTFSAGELPSKAADKFNAGSCTMPSYTAGTLPELTTAVENETLTISFNKGTLATYEKGSYTAPSFTPGEFKPGTLPSFTEGKFTAASLADGFYTAGTAASKDADTFSGGTATVVTLPTFKDQTAMTGATYLKQEINTAEFAGTPEADLKVTAVTYKKQEVATKTFEGTTATGALVTGVSYDKASVTAATFTGTAATIESTGTATGDVTLKKTDKEVPVAVS